MASRDLDASTRLESRLETLDQVSSTVAHEIRNNLTSIKMSLYMLEQGLSPSEEQSMHFSIANEELRRIELYLRELISHTLPLTPALTRVDLREAVGVVLEASTSMLSHKSVAVQRSFPDQPAWVRADPGLLERSVSQLLRNACDALPRGGTVQVSIHRPESATSTAWELTLQDDGTGFAGTDPETLFEPFATTRAHRLGMGLTGVRRALRAQGGEATARNATPAGAVVTLQLPDAPDTED